MAGVSLTFKMDFPQSEIWEELWAEFRKDEPKLQAAMQEVAAATLETLKEHIQKDVYDKWNPTTYVRRKESGGLIDFSHIDPSVGSGGMTVYYAPSGASEQWDNPLDSNGLIGRIESGSGYEWYRHPGPRPFWKNFVNDMVNEKFATAYDFAMSAQFGSDYEGGTVVERESGDGDY